MDESTRDAAATLAAARKCLLALAEDVADIARELNVSSICMDVDVHTGTIEVDMYTTKMERVLGFSADLEVGQ